MTRPDKLPPTFDSRCGTRAGYAAHRRRGEAACGPCRLANRKRSRRLRATDAGREAHRAATREANRRLRATDAGREAARVAVRATLERYRARSEAEADRDWLRLHPSGLRACRGCGELLPADAFQRHWATPDGRRDRCDHNGCRKRHQRLKRDARLHAHWRARGIDPAVCLYCGAPATDVEHVWPQALGGGDDFSNLAPACSPCNGSKSAARPADWLAEAHPGRLAAVAALFPRAFEGAQHAPPLQL